MQVEVDQSGKIGKKLLGDAIQAAGLERTRRPVAAATENFSILKIASCFSWALRQCAPWPARRLRYICSARNKLDAHTYPFGVPPPWLPGRLCRGQKHVKTSRSVYTFGEKLTRSHVFDSDNV